MSRLRAAHAPGRTSSCACDARVRDHFLVEGWEFTAGSIETMPFLFVAKQPWYAAMPVAGLLMTAVRRRGVVAHWWFAPQPVPAKPPTADIPI